MSRLLNAALFYATWFACVLGAAWRMPVAGVVVAVGVLGAHLLLSPQRSHELILIAAAGILGFVIDSSQAFAGIFAFASRGPVEWLCPLWLAAIWMAFASTLNASMSWLDGRYLIAAGLGAVGGPLSYAYGAKLGAMTITSPHFSLVLATVWALAMPALLWINQALRRSFRSTPDDVRTADPT